MRLHLVLVVKDTWATGSLQLIASGLIGEDDKSVGSCHVCHVCLSTDKESKGVDLIRVNCHNATERLCADAPCRLIESFLNKPTQAQMTTTGKDNAMVASTTDSDNSSSSTQLSSSNTALAIGVIMVGMSAGMTLYTRRTRTMLQQMDKVTKNQSIRKGPPKEGPPTKEQHEKMKPRWDDNEIL